MIIRDSGLLFGPPCIVPMKWFASLSDQLGFLLTYITLHQLVQ